MGLLREFFLFGISLENWLYALIATLLSYLVLDLLTRLGVRFAKKRLSILARITKRRVDEVILAILDGSKRYLYFLFSLLIGMQTLILPAKLELRLAQAMVVIIGVQVAIWINRGINSWMEKLVDPEENADLRHRATTTTMVFLLRMVVMLTVLLTVLANIGVNITAFVASLGIGGVAIALALQTVLGDLFAFLSIGLDKPFEVGDFIVVDDLQGTVEYIGIKTTRLRSLSGEQLIRSNAELLKSAIRNFKRMSERRVVFAFGVTHQTSGEQITALTQAIREIITTMRMTRFDRAHFVRIGENSLEFEVVYYMLSSQYNEYMDTQQSINLKLMQVCAEHEIAFAHPTRTLHVASKLEVQAKRPDPIGNEKAEEEIAAL